MPHHVLYRGRRVRYLGRVIGRGVIGRGRRLAGLIGRALLAATLTTTASAADRWIEFALNDAGEIHLAPRTLAPQDYVMAVYAERIQDLPISPRAVPAAPGSLPGGCLPLVRIETASGTRRLPKEADLTFGCRELPENARIHAWIDGAWAPVPARRLPDGRIHARFRRTAVYGVFLVPDVPRI